MSILQDCWKKLDDIVDEIIDYEGNEEAEVAHLRGKARGMAEFLAIFMVPHFRTTDEISKEAKRRRKARLAGEPVETKGLGSRTYEFDTSKYEPKLPAKKTPAKRESTKKEALPFSVVSELERKAIRDAAHLMTKAELAIVYSITERQVQEILDATG